VKPIPCEALIAGIDDIKQETMLFSCDYETAMEFGGQLTWKFLAHIPEEQRKNVIIDSRFHMLKRGWYPAIPGWHLDDIPRGNDGQPDLSRGHETNHLFMIVDSGTGSLTEFLHPHDYLDLKEVLTNDYPKGKTIWGHHNDVINSHLKWLKDSKSPVPVKSGIPYWFGHEDYHRAIPATGDGWRWFIRASLNSQRPITNELRTQVQVYLPQPEAGW
jgi:hypothetical protein